MYKRINEPLIKNDKVLFAIGDTCNEIIGDSVNWELVKTSVWDLKYGDTYYLLNASGHVVEQNWVDCKECIEERQQGNTSLIKEELEEVSWRRTFEIKMIDAFKPWECDWNDKDKQKFNVCYNNYIREIKYVNNYSNEYQGVIYCNDNEVVERFIKDNEQDLIRYFGVEKND